MSFSRPWFENLAARTLEKDQSILLACVAEQDKILAILPLIQQSDGNWRQCKLNCVSALI